MNIEEFRKDTTFLYHVTKYPIFLLDDQFMIMSVPDSFIDVPTDFFVDYQTQAKEAMLQKQLVYLLYFHRYFYLFIPMEEEQNYIWIGPVLFDDILTEQDRKQNAFLVKLNIQADRDSLQILPVLQENFIFVLQFLFEKFLYKPISIDQLSNAFRQKMRSNTEHTLQIMKSKKREIDTRQYNYADELKLLYHIRQGDDVLARIVASKLTKGRIGQLSSNKSKSSLYAFISLATMVSRTAMDCGVDTETAYGLHDVYIQKADQITSSTDLRKLCMDIVVDFCLLVKQCPKEQYPVWVNQCINFIVCNLHQPITLAMIAEEVHMLASYVSVQFKKITGIPLMMYIQHKKIEEAAFLLRSTNTPILEISTLLAFSSQAYFSSVFKKQMGSTPKAYRNQNPNLIEDVTRK